MKTIIYCRQACNTKNIDSNPRKYNLLQAGPQQENRDSNFFAGRSATRKYRHQPLAGSTLLQAGLLQQENIDSNLLQAGVQQENINSTSFRQACNKEI
jgi:hypothetical protein